MRFDSSTFYSIIGVVPFRKKYLHSTSVLSSLSSFSNTSKVTIRGWLTQPSSPLKKTPLPPEVRQNCLREQSLRQLPSCLPARAGAVAQKTEHPQRKKYTKLLGQLRWRGSTVDGFARGGGMTPLATRCKGKARMLPWDAPLGCCPTNTIILLPRQGETSQFHVRGKTWPRGIRWGDLEKFWEISMVWNSIFHWERFWESAGEKEAGKQKPMGKRSSLPRL